MTCSLIHRRALSSTARFLKQKSAAAHLFEQAAKEERAEQQLGQTRRPTVPDSDVWTGEERTQDAVLRMLIDSYKSPKIEGWAPKRKVQQPTERAIEFEEESPEELLEAASSTDQSSQPEEAPAYPWLVTFKPPKHYTGLGGLRNPKRKIKAPSGSRASVASRLENIKEKRVDRGWGDRQSKLGEQEQPRHQRPLDGPVGVFSLVEERIQRAQAQGMFKNIKGRGQPFKRDENERNPFIGRDEFLLNRLIANNEACPPWIDLQQQLDSTLETFRQTLRGDWVRRAIRMITLSGFQHLLEPDAIAFHARKFRDPEWEARERGFHSLTLKQINSLTRSYNALAPPSVRRGLYSLDDELELCFKDSVPVIQSELRKRLEKKDQPDIDAGHSDPVEKVSMWQAFKQMVREKPWRSNEA